MNPRPLPPSARAFQAGPPPGRWLGLGALHGAVLLFGVAGLFGKWVQAPALVIVFGRVVVAAAGLALLLRLWPGAARPLGRGDRMALWACGALLAFHWATFFHAIQVSTVAVGLVAYSTAPVFVALLEPAWFRERFSPWAALAAAVTVGGVALMVPRWEPGAAVLQAAGWGVLSGLSFAVLSLANRALVRRHAAIRVALHQDLAAAVWLAPILPWVWTPLGAADLALLAVLGLVCTALAHALFIQALRSLTARTASLAAALEPVYGIGLAWLLLGERPALRTVAGGCTILAAVLWSLWHSARSR